MSQRVSKSDLCRCSSSPLASIPCFKWPRFPLRTMPSLIPLPQKPPAHSTPRMPINSSQGTPINPPTENPQSAGHITLGCHQPDGDDRSQRQTWQDCHYAPEVWHYGKSHAQDSKLAGLCQRIEAKVPYSTAGQPACSFSQGQT